MYIKIIFQEQSFQKNYITSVDAKIPILNKYKYIQYKNNYTVLKKLTI